MAQHLVDPAIDVYDATDSSHPLLYRLQGHTFGGQCMVADPRNNILYSGSLDKTIRCVNDHRDLLLSQMIKALSHVLQILEP